MNRSPRPLLLLYILAVVLAACSSGAAASPAASAAPSQAAASPAASAAPSQAASSPAGSGGPAAGGPVTSADEAAAAVIAQNQQFADLQAYNADMIGQCCFYRVEPAANGWTVTVEVGWGDCPAGCIDRHQWTYTVTPTGVVTLTGESGPRVPSGVPGGG